MGVAVAESLGGKWTLGEIRGGRVGKNCGSREVEGMVGLAGCRPKVGLDVSKWRDVLVSKW